MPGVGAMPGAGAASGVDALSGAQGGGQVTGLVAEGLVRRYGRSVALDGFALSVAPGEIVGLVGHNGAGKTTFVEIVSGLTRPDAGRVSVAGVDVLAQPRRARLGVCPQETSLYPRLTVAEHLRLFGALADCAGPRSAGR
jgi:ABC-2 type transport system ATP-binding protein